jgi:hypothetical protein
MDLRDRFAVHFAAALADVFPEPEEIARRAYDLAEALLRERAHRIDHDEQAALLDEHRAATILLDEPMPELDEEELDLEPPYDPSWDLEDRLASEPAHASRPPGPGLARTAPEAAETERKERSA